MALLKKDWLPKCDIERVVTHWTVGRHTANDFEREHYHFLIEASGTIVRGERSVADNVSTVDGVYAAHTLGCNRGSIGVALCGMIGTQEKPFRPGSEPITEAQYFVMARAVAELCAAYSIAVTPQTVLGHGEVQANLGIKQRGKWDPMVLPWDTDRSYSEVGNYFRTLVRRASRGESLTGTVSVATLVRVAARIKDKPFADAVLEDGSSYVPIAPVAAAFGWKVADAPGDGDAVTLQIGKGAKQTLDTKLFAGSGYVSARDLAAALSVLPGWDKETRTVIIE